MEILLRCDYNVRDLEAELEEARLARRASHQAEKGDDIDIPNFKLLKAKFHIFLVRIRDYDSGERSPLPGGRAIFGGSQRKHDGTKADDDEEIVYRPSNQLVPPSPGIMQRKKVGVYPLDGAHRFCLVADHVFFIVDDIQRSYAGYG